MWMPAMLVPMLFRLDFDSGRMQHQTHPA